MRTGRKLILVFKKGKMDLGNYRPVSFILIPRNVMEQIILENISKNTKESQEGD